jgi:hypothetical protein
MNDQMKADKEAKTIEDFADYLRDIEMLSYTLDESYHAWVSKLNNCYTRLGLWLKPALSVSPQRFSMELSTLKRGFGPFRVYKIDVPVLDMRLGLVEFQIRPVDLPWVQNIDGKRLIACPKNPQVRIYEIREYDDSRLLDTPDLYTCSKDDLARTLHSLYTTYNSQC